MMFRPILFVLAASSVFADYDNKHKPPPHYDYKQISYLLDKNFQCLEKYDVLTVNATDQLILGASDMKYFIDTCSLDSSKKADVQAFLDRYQNLYDVSKLAYPETDGAKFFWQIMEYVNYGDYKFIYGLLYTEKSTRKTLEEIFQDNQLTTSGRDCIARLIQENGFPTGFRQCTNPCKDLAESKNFKTGLPAIERFNYFDAMLNLRCLNYGPATNDRIVPICSYLMRQADVFWKNRHTPEYNLYRFFYYNMVSKCGSYGLAEAADYRFVTDIANSIDCDGCIKNTETDEEKQVLTALSTSILAYALRYSAELKGCASD